MTVQPHAFPYGNAGFDHHAQQKNDRAHLAAVYTFCNEILGQGIHADQTDNHPDRQPEGSFIEDNDTMEQTADAGEDTDEHGYPVYVHDRLYLLAACAEQGSEHQPAHSRVRHKTADQQDAGKQV
ncbi:hypothetical protein D3C71_1781320 [compost metagenome]